MAEAKQAAPILEVDDLSVHFRLRRREGTLRAVDGVSFHVLRGETLGLIGESGSGKSTIGLAILGLVAPSGGGIRFRGEPLASMSADRMKLFRRSVQAIFQDPHAALDPRMTAWDSVMEPLNIHGVGDRGQREDRVASLFERVGLRRNIHGKRYPHELSGGQKQRINIARALTLEPELLICDEPVSALDVSLQASILNLLRDLQSDFNLTLVFVSHDLGVVRHVADRVAVVYLGKVLEVAPVQDVLDRPLHPYTKALVSSIPRLAPVRTNGSSRRIVLKGEVPSPVDPPAGCRFRTRCPYARAGCEQPQELRAVALGGPNLVACAFAEEIHEHEERRDPPDPSGLAPGTRKGNSC